MTDLNLMKELHIAGDSKILMLVLDGLGGLPKDAGGKTELETAQTPHFDRLARDGLCGLSLPIGQGITPGSGPSHLALFGYDPLRHEIGRGVLEALGIGFDLGSDDVAARGNFCTVDADGLIIDRRAGRISTEKCRELVSRLRKITLPDVHVFVEPVEDYRFALILRARGLSGAVTETDPQQIGKAPLPVEPLSPDAEPTAHLLNLWIEQAADILAGEEKANMVTLRGIARNPGLPPMPEIYGLRCAAIATYPMYRGVSKLVGMDVLEAGHSIEEEISALKSHWHEYDFFYFHIKKTDSAGEDGDFEGKVSLIEKVDAMMPEILSLKPDVILVTGDHSTPAVMKSHSWHPVPFLLWSDRCRPDAAQHFGERDCAGGSLGQFPAKEIMSLAMANAGRLSKYGA